MAFTDKARIHKTPLAILLIVLPAAAALAHAGVTNPAVMKRMDSMKSSGDSMEAIGRMVKNEAPFDAALAQKSIANISAQAAKTTALFQAPETDPKSEAKPEIWTDFEDFVTRADEMRKLAQRYEMSVATPQDLTTAVGALSKACRSCHTAYKE